MAGGKREWLEACRKKMNKAAKKRKDVREFKKELRW